MVRRLPVIQNKAPEDAEAEERPPWHWVLIGTGFVITIWLPLVMIAVWIGGALPVLLSLALACGAGGALVGRFGGRAGVREATLSGVVAAACAWGLALLSGALSPWTIAVMSALVLFAAAAIFSWVGGRIGALRRPR